MKSDLDRLMQENDLDVILITGPAQHNPAMVYMTGGAHLTNADLIKNAMQPQSCSTHLWNVMKRPAQIYKQRI